MLKLLKNISSIILLPLAWILNKLIDDKIANE